MRLRVLADNNTLIDCYYVGEPAACYYIEAEGLKLLFDTGYSDVFLRNAAAMGLRLTGLTHVVLSHGHNDHTNGLPLLWQAVDVRDAALVAHPGCFHKKYVGDDYVGAPCTAEEAGRHMRLCLSAAPVWLTEHCVFLGQIPRENDFEGRTPIGWEETRDGRREDCVEEDSALAFRTAEGLFIVTGCSHSGICNIIAHARRVCREERIAGVLGGFHLLESGERLERTARYLEGCGVARLYPCHCVSLEAKARLLRTLPVHELGVGSEIEA